MNDQTRENIFMYGIAFMVLTFLVFAYLFIFNSGTRLKVWSGVGFFTSLAVVAPIITYIVYRSN